MASEFIFLADNPKSVVTIVLDGGETEATGGSVVPGDADVRNAELFAETPD